MVNWNCFTGISSFWAVLVSKRTNEPFNLRHLEMRQKLKMFDLTPHPHRPLFESQSKSKLPVLVLYGRNARYADKTDKIKTCCYLSLCVDGNMINELNRLFSSAVCIV